MIQPFIYSFSTSYSSFKLYSLIQGFLGFFSTTQTFYRLYNPENLLQISNFSMPPSIHPPLRLRYSPSMEAIRVPVDLSDDDLIQALLSVADELVSSSSGKKKMAFQWRNSRSLIRKTQVLVVLLESLKESGLVYSFTALLCFKELYLLLCRSKILLDYCFQSSKLWMILQNVSISGHFNDLSQEISTLLDVLPINELNLSIDVREQIVLLKRQLRKEKLCVDKQNEVLRRRFYSFLNEFENGRVPDYVDLHSFFVEGMGIKDARSCKAEIEFLEEQMCNLEGDLEPSPAILNGFVALARFSRLLLFGYEEDVVRANPRMMKKMNSILGAPTDFLCSISLDLMIDPVIVSTGQTYDRSSIMRWMEDGHCTCPKTGQMLTHKRLAPNQALRNLIHQWCTSNGTTLDDDSEIPSSVSVPNSKAVLEAKKATTSLLIKQLREGSENLKANAAGEIRLMAKTSNEVRAFLAESGAISSLCKLLLSPNVAVQENSITAILNLSIHERNKIMIMEEEGCLEMIVNVLRYGHTSESRENAAAALFSLSIVRDNKKKIAESKGAIEALVRLLNEGTNRGKKDAITALFNLSTHPRNCSRMIESGAVKALVGALDIEGASEEAAAALSLIVRQPIGAEAVANEESAFSGLIGMMRRSTPKGKENAVATLLELCRVGGNVVVERVIKTPSLASLLQTLLYTGTKRAKRKAASLARAFQRREQAVLRFGGHNNEVRLPMPISVQVV